jgi:hypothetical protein
MKRIFCAGLFILGIAALAASAQAATANFQGNCTWNSTNTVLNCVFNAQRPTSSPSICADGTSPSNYAWTFGDGGTASGFSSFVSHPYNPPPAGQYGYYPTLTITCPEGPATLQRYICIYGFGYPGCIFQDGNWY